MRLLLFFSIYLIWFVLIFTAEFTKVRRYENYRDTSAEVYILTLETGIFGSGGVGNLRSEGV
jgi:hypothetical protein